MKRFIQRLIIKIYWKLNCHTVEPFAEQLVLYAIPGIAGKKALTIIAYQIKENLERNCTEILPICGSVFPDTDIVRFNKLDLEELK